MKICLLNRFFDFRNAGLGRVGLEVRNELVDRGYKVGELACSGTSLYSYFLYTSMSIPLRMPKTWDIYHALTPMEAIYIPKARGVVTFHDLFQITDRDKLGSGLGYSKWKNQVGVAYFKMAAKIASRCKGIVAVSEKTRDELVEYLGIDPSRIKVIHSGIRSDLTPWERKDKVFRLGYLGQLDRRKRLDLLIDAFKSSKLEELVIGGIGIDEALLKERTGNDSRIKFLGLVPDEKLVAFYNSLDVFVFPTWIEGYGLPLVEAMACGKPCVVLLDANIPWEVKRRCIIVEELDYVLGNETYLRNLCSSVDVKDNIEWARSHSWSRCVDQYLEVYEQVKNS